MVASLSFFFFCCCRLEGENDADSAAAADDDDKWLAADIYTLNIYDNECVRRLDSPETCK